MRGRSDAVQLRQNQIQLCVFANGKGQYIVLNPSHGSLPCLFPFRHDERPLESDWLSSGAKRSGPISGYPHPAGSRTAQIRTAVRIDQYISE